MEDGPEKEARLKQMLEWEEALRKREEDARLQYEVDCVAFVDPFLCGVFGLGRICMILGR